jgi:hypothetical protein
MTLGIPVRNAQEAMNLLDMIREHGLVIEQDFTWAFMPSQYDGWDDTSHTQPTVEFTFRDPAMATYFQLKFS